MHFLLNDIISFTLIPVANAFPRLIYYFYCRHFEKQSYAFFGCIKESKYKLKLNLKLKERTKFIKNFN